MTIRTKRKTVTFRSPFLLDSIGRSLSAGTYEVTTDEELIEGLSFPVYRRIATMMLVPAESSSAVEMLTIDPSELAVALDRDAAAENADGKSSKVQ